LSADDSIDYQRLLLDTLEAMPWPALIVDREMAIHFVNQHAAQLAESGSIPPGTRLDAVFDDQRLLNLCRESIESGQPRQDTYEKDSAGTTWKVSMTPLAHAVTKEQVEQRACSLFALVIEDLSELRRVERVRSDFVANISHELRTPLASVRLLVETLEDAIDTDPERAQEFLGKIETEVEYLTALVSELLELSRLESGMIVMNREPVGAELLVRETMARMLPLAQRHRVTLRTEIQQGDTLVNADSKQIARALVNLVHNAIKFTPSGGEITIGTMRVEDAAFQRFFVRDTGVGIPAAELPRIFERFYKVDRARAKTDFIGPGGGGSGLGLAIARHIVEAHGGSISAESVVGTGSTFAFTLPVVS
jgi:two-component system phosphate regulon sensor histidine kinase PhoR